MFISFIFWAAAPLESRVVGSNLLRLKHGLNFVPLNKNLSRKCWPPFESSFPASTWLNCNFWNPQHPNIPKRDPNILWSLCWIHPSRSHAYLRRVDCCQSIYVQSSKIVSKLLWMFWDSISGYMAIVNQPRKLSVLPIPTHLQLIWTLGFLQHLRLLFSTGKARPIPKNHGTKTFANCKLDFLEHSQQWHSTTKSDTDVSNISLTSPTAWWRMLKLQKDADTTYCQPMLPISMIASPMKQGTFLVVNIPGFASWPLFSPW